MEEYTQGYIFPIKEKTSWAEDHVHLNELFGIGPPDTVTGIHNILQTNYMTKEWGLPPKQVLLAGDGHWWITLDYRKRTEPCVTWLDVEIGEDIRIANSFSEFISGLQLAPEEDESISSEEFVWRPESINFEIRRDDQYLKIGQYLHLEQILDDSEKGWSMSKFDIPEHWSVSKLEMKAGIFCMTINTGETFKISPKNFGTLSFAILDGGNKSDESLECIWKQYALY